MNLNLLRNKFREDGIFGELTAPNFHCFTLEHSYDCKPKLSDGTYTCKRGEHKLKDGVPFITFEIMDVPGHWGILFHVGNYNKDSEGCVLVGTGIGNTSKKGLMLTASKQAFAKFLDLLKDCDEFTLTVESSKP